MRIIEFTSENIFIECNEQIGNKLDGVYLRGRQVYRVPNNLGALRDLHALGFDVSKYGKEKAAARQELIAKKGGVPALYPTFNQDLRPYQKQDASYLLQGKAFGVFNEQRTG